MEVYIRCCWVCVYMMKRMFCSLFQLFCLALWILSLVRLVDLVHSKR